MAEQKQPPSADRPDSVPLVTGVLMSLAVCLVIGLIGMRMEHRPDTSRRYPSRSQMPDGANVLLPAPKINDEYLPCDGECHLSNDMRTNIKVREMEEDHDEMEFSHGDLWCLNCHDRDNRDWLCLSDRSLVGFEESWLLCTQCHAKKLPDWRAGVHGKRTGHWRGTKEYQTCVACHDPHDPRFKSIAPRPAPRRPEEIVQRMTRVRERSETEGGES